MSVDSTALLWPPPPSVDLPGGTSTPPSPLTVALRGTESADVLRPLRRELGGVGDAGALAVDRVDDGGWLRVRRVDGKGLDGEAYRLRVRSEGADLVAATEAGLYRGTTTLAQWLDLHRPDLHGGGAVPCLVVEDRPDFAHRGVLLDVSRNKVPTLETLFELVDLLAALKVNQLQLYTEHTFAYRGHETVWEGYDPLTGDDVDLLDAHCRSRFVELVPNQNSFGHLHRWLVHDAYRDLAEVPEGFVHPFSPDPEPFSLNPLDPRSLDLLRDLYDQLLPHFRSRLFNVGLDETMDLGKGRSAEACRERGTTRVYLDFLRQVHALVRAHDRRMQFWGDVVLEKPELVPELPDDAIALLWGYEADHPFAEQTATMAKAGLDFYVCPGTSSWMAFGGRWTNARHNLRRAAVAGREAGALGYLVTDWGDRGHLQPLATSYPGLLAGAGFAWNADAPDDASWAALLDHHILHDRVAAEALLRLGDAYRVAGPPLVNGAAPFLTFMVGPEDLERRGGADLQPDDVAAIAAEGRAAAAAVGDDGPAGLVRREIRWAAEAMTVAARWGGAHLARCRGEAPGDDVSYGELVGDVERLLDGFESVWTERYRRGGLAGSKALVRRRSEAVGRALTGRGPGPRPGPGAGGGRAGR